MSLEFIRELVNTDMDRVDQSITREFGTDIQLIRQMGEHIFASGGKRLRPILVILASKLFGYSGEQHIQLAAIIELIHTATLLHDDVVDDSSLRRGKKTANKIWGNDASVLVGDYIYSRSFQMMVRINSMAVMEILAHAANTIAEGEVMQLVNCNNPDTSEEQYMQTIRCKTATLFSAASKLGAIINNRPEKEIHALANYGLHLGTAFQLIDDALDYGAVGENIGKNIGDDLAEGKPTLPLIHILKCGTHQEKEIVSKAIKQGGCEDIQFIQQALKSTNAMTYVYDKAKSEINYALKELEQFPLNRYLDGLKQLAHFAISRTF